MRTFTLRRVDGGQFLVEPGASDPQLAAEGALAPPGGRSLCDVFGAALGERIQHGAERCVEIGAPIDCEGLDVEAGRGLCFKLIPVGCAAGEVQKVVGVEQAAAGSETSPEKYAQIVRISPVGIAVTELYSARLLDVNPAFEQTFRVSRDIAIGRTLIELGCWENPADRLVMIERIIAEGSVHDYEVRARTYTGEPLRVLLSSEQVVIQGIPCLVTFVHDVTEQVAAERALRESEEKFATAFRVSPFSMSILDRETDVYLDVNQGFERMFECSREQVIGRTVGELGLWAEPEQRQPLLALRERGPVREYPVVGLTFKGKLLRGSVSSELIELGGRECILSIERDLTAQYQAEQMRGELERQLREAQKLEALGTLAGGIAHDFNNILGAILAYTDLMKLDIEDPVALASHIGELRSAGGRARDLVRQILTFSRRENPERRPVRLDAVVREALKLLRAALPATVELEIFIAPQLPVVLADPSQIHQVLMNLSTNAAHAMRERTGKLSVRLEAVDVTSSAAAARGDLNSGRYVRLTVSDTGHGMDAYALKRLFEPFFTTKPPGEGTGLGLSVVHGIVRGHDGSIAVHSLLGEGTTFELHFPEHPAELTAEADVASTLINGRGEHLLLVEDEPMLRQSLARLLDRLGYRVSARHHPVAALELFFNDPSAIDLVLTDLTMPALTGVEMARQMLGAHPDARILLMSGYSPTWNRDSVRELGIRELMTKPIAASVLAGMLRQTLDERIVRRSA